MVPGALFHRFFSQFLSVNVEPFQEQFLSTSILRRLIKKYDVIEDIRHKDTKPTYIYERNKPSDFFCLVLQVGTKAPVRG